MGQGLAAGAGDLQAHYLLACALHHNGDFAGAVRTYEEVLALDHYHAEATRFLASALISLGDFECAGRIIADIERFGGSPGHALHHQYALILVQQGRYSEALDHCASALKLNPGNEKTRILQAEALQATGDYDGALDILRPMLESDHVPPDAVLVFVKFSIAFDMRKEALTLLEKVERAMPINAPERTEIAKAKTWLEEH